MNTGTNSIRTIIFKNLLEHDFNHYLHTQRGALSAKIIG